MYVHVPILDSQLVDPWGGPKCKPGCGCSRHLQQMARAWPDVLVPLRGYSVAMAAAIPNESSHVYMSTATGTGCNSGYFGAQFHSDGTQTLLFSMWDAPQHGNNTRYVFQSLPGSKHCRRNALDSHGKSTGVQCAPNIANESVRLEFGVPYVSCAIGGNDSHGNNTSTITGNWGQSIDQGLMEVVDRVKQTGKRVLILIGGEFGRTPQTVAPQASSPGCIAW